MMEKMALVSFVDWIIVFLLVVGLLYGWRKGLSSQLIELSSVIVALAAAWFLCRPVARFLAEQGRLAPQTATVIAFAALVVLGYVIARLIRAGAQKLVEFKFKGALEPAGGAIAGLLLATVVLLVIVVAAGWLPQERLRREITELSFASRALAPVVNPVRRYVLHRFPELQAPAPAAPAPDAEMETPAARSERDELVPRAIRPIDEPRR